MADMVQIAVQLPYDKAKRLQKWAKDSGYTFHRYMQKILGEFATGEPRLYKHDHQSNSDSNLEDLTETIVVNIPLQLGQRLHAAARQMRDPSDKAVSPSWLARQIVQHYLYKRSDIIERIKKEVDPAYVDHVAFPARTILSAGRVLYPMPIKTSLAAREAIFAAAKAKDMSVTKLATTILDKVLPAWTGATN